MVELPRVRCSMQPCADCSVSQDASTLMRRLCRRATRSRPAAARQARASSSSGSAAKMAPKSQPRCGTQRDTRRPSLGGPEAADGTDGEDGRASARPGAALRGLGPRGLGPGGTAGGLAPGAALRGLSPGGIGGLGHLAPGSGVPGLLRPARAWRRLPVALQTSPRTVVYFTSRPLEHNRSRHLLFT